MAGRELIILEGASAYSEQLSAVTNDVPDEKHRAQAGEYQCHVREAQSQRFQSRSPVSVPGGLISRMVTALWSFSKCRLSHQIRLNYIKLQDIG